jgi:hypothetical protein
MIEDLFNRLIGMRILFPARSVDIVSFQVAPISQVNDELLYGSELGVFALHIKPPFRFHRRGKIFIGSADIFTPRNESDFESFDWMIPNGSFFDEVIEKIFDPKKTKFIIRSIEINELGDLTLRLSSDLCLNVFCCGQSQVEYWRIIEFGVSHWVMKKGKIEVRKDV